MRLVDLGPEWLRFEERVESYQVLKPGRDALRGDWTDDDWHEVVGPRAYHLHASSLQEAHGISFLCPLCFAANGGAAGTHGVTCWFEGRVPDSADPGPGRWNPAGSGFDDLSFVPGRKSNSVQLVGGCNWHGFITNGQVTLA